MCLHRRERVLARYPLQRYTAAFWTKISLAGLRATFSISSSTLVISPVGVFLYAGINEVFEREVNRSDMRGAGRMALRRGLAEGEGFRMQEDGADWGFFGL